MESKSFKPSRIRFKINIKFNLRNTIQKSVLTPVRCIVRYNNQKIVFPSPFKIEPKNWNVLKQEARSNQRNQDGKTINKLIKDIKDTIEETFDVYINKNEKYPPVDVFKMLVLKELSIDRNIATVNKTIDLLSFIEQIIPEMESGKRLTFKGKPFAENSIKIFRTLKANLLIFKNTYSYDLDFSNINLNFFEDFKDFMLFSSLDYSTNTLAKHIRVLKSVIADAFERGLTNYQFIGKKYNAKTEIVDTIYLNQVELLTLCKLDLNDNYKLDRTRDLFILGCWTGLRFSDFSKIDPRDVQIDRFKIKTKKTNQTVIIPILKYVEDIITKYKGKTINNLPPPITNQKMNTNLKELGKLANINEVITKEFTKGGKAVKEYHPKYSLISTHTARRSFATNMYLLGVPSISIMALTGHKTEDNFLKYIRVNPDEHAEIVRKYFEANKLGDLEFNQVK